MKIVIPVRMASQRFPGKPLHTIGGKTLLRRCYENVARFAGDVIIATPDVEIIKEVGSWGDYDLKDVVMTTTSCINGTERVAQVVDILGIDDGEIVVNLQGDQFGFDGDDFVMGPVGLVESGKAKVATDVTKLSRGDVENENVVKALFVGEDYFDTLFTRYLPNAYMGVAYKHVGIYVSTARRFREYARMTPRGDEISQRLEQLRWYPYYKVASYCIKDQPTVVDARGR